MTEAIYTRISETDDTLGVERQHKDCAALAKRLKLRHVELYEDNDVSATKIKIVRPAYQQLLADIRAGKITHVVAWHSDRLYRRLDELPELIDVVNAHGVKISTVMSGDIDLTTANGRMIARINGAVATNEVERISERLVAQRKQAAEAGKWNGGRRPTGYQITHVDGERTLVIDEREAAAIKTAVESVLAGTSLVVAADVFSEALGKSMRMSTLRQTIEKPMLAGLAIYRGEVIGRGNWPAIITEEQHYALTALFTQRKTGKNPRATRKHLGTGIYRCATCGQVVTSFGSAAGRNQRRYRCEAGCCARLGAGVDDYAKRIVELALSTPEVVAALAKTDANVDVTPLRAERQQLVERQTQLVAAFNAGVLTMQAVTEGSVAARERIEEIDAQLARVGKTSGVASILLAAVPAEAFLAADVDQQRALLASMIEVTLLPASKGRPAGWKVGEPYFDKSRVRITSKIEGLDFDSLRDIA